MKKRNDEAQLASSFLFRPFAGCGSIERAFVEVLQHLGGNGKTISQALWRTPTFFAEDTQFFRGMQEEISGESAYSDELLFRVFTEKQKRNRKV